VNTNGNRTFLKVFLGVLLILCVCAAGVAIWVAEHYKVIIRERLPGWVSKSTDSLYYISFEDVSINIVTRRITINNVKIWYDTTQKRNFAERGRAPHYYYSMNIPMIQAKKIAWEELIGDKNLGCGELNFFSPKIIVDYMPELVDSLKDTAKKKPAIDRVFFDEINISNGTFIYKTIKREGSSILYAGGINAGLTNWIYEPNASGKDTNRFVFAEGAAINIKKILYKQDKLLYTIRSKGLHFESLKDSLTILGFTFTSNVSKQEYYRQSGMQKDMFDLDFPLVAFSGFNWSKMMNGGQLITLF
jgi:hypothetical protein